MGIWIRPSRPEFMDAIIAVNDAAFGGPASGELTYPAAFG